MRLGQDKNTVTFTASEFEARPSSRTAAAARITRGSNHHIIVSTGSANGGPLYGGKFYGQYPSLVLNGPDDANTRGTMVPTTSVDQYAATLCTVVRRLGMERQRHLQLCR